MKKLLLKFCNRETISYLIFGVLTTAVNYLVYHLAKAALGAQWIVAVNTVAFLAAVVFAYITNKLFVFQEKSWAPRVLVREIPAFFGARLLSFGLETAGLALCQYVLLGEGTTIFTIDGIDFCKYLLSVVTVVLNYFISKFYIFRKE